MKASVVVTNRNYGRYLEEAIRPYLQEGSSETEVVVVDDASTDDSRERIALLAAADGRIRPVMRERCGGPSTAYNDGLRAARHEIVLVQSADDAPLPGRLAAQVRAMKAPGAPDVLGGWMRRLGEAGEDLGEMGAPLSHEEIAAALPVQNPIYHPAVALRRSRLLDLGGHDEALGAAVDLDLWLRSLRAGLRFGCLAVPLVRYRIHDASISVARRDLQRTICRRLYASHLGVPVSDLARAQQAWAKKRFAELVPAAPFVVCGQGAAGRAVAAWAKGSGRTVLRMCDAVDLGARRPEAFVVVATLPGRAEAVRCLEEAGLCAPRDYIEATGIIQGFIGGPA